MTKFINGKKTPENPSKSPPKSQQKPFQHSGMPHPDTGTECTQQRRTPVCPTQILELNALKNDYRKREKNTRRKQSSAGEDSNGVFHAGWRTDGMKMNHSGKVWHPEQSRSKGLAAKDESLPVRTTNLHAKRNPPSPAGVWNQTRL